MKNLADLVQIHRELDDIFAAHQYALLHFDFATALQRLQRYEDGLLSHMKDEEVILLPVYKERGTIVKGGDAKLFLDEHQKMRGWVTFFKEQVARLQCEPHPESDLILLLDRESFYKRLSSHHDRRETEILYPEMDRITSEKEKLEILKRVIRTVSV